MSDESMLELFKMEVEQQCAMLNESLLALDQMPTSEEHLEAAMRASHSIKGAARLLEIDSIQKIAHLMEDILVAAQESQLLLDADDVDVLLQGMDIIKIIAADDSNLQNWHIKNQSDYVNLLNRLGLVLNSDSTVSEEAARSGSDSGHGHDYEAEKPEDTELPVELISIQDMSMLDLFRIEVEQHGTALSKYLLALEQEPESPALLEQLMRAAHSIKGAARLVGVELVVRLAHAMEDDFVAAQRGEITLNADQVDYLLQGVDTIYNIAFYEGDLQGWFKEKKTQYSDLLSEIKKVLDGETKTESAIRTVIAADVDAGGDEDVMPSDLPASQDMKIRHSDGRRKEDKRSAVNPRDRVLRVSAELVNRLMGLAGESLVESRWLYPYSESLRRLKRHQTELIVVIDSLRSHVESENLSDEIRGLVRSAQKQASNCREYLSDRLTELESFDRRSANLSSRLHQEVVGSRMRPFGDGVHGFPRMVRDIARLLKKNVQLMVEGETTLVDRDILDKIEAPLNHIIRNAIDHGIELPEVRTKAGKAEKGIIRLSAYHNAGLLSIVVEDDGRGVDVENLRRKIIQKGLVDENIANSLSETELFEFLFLPSFSTREQVSEISGRGVGLDVVHDAVQEMRGSVKISSKPGQGTRFHMQLPLTLSVISALLVEIAGEPYAFPLARIDRIASVNHRLVSEAEGNQYVRINDINVGLVSASQLLEKESAHEMDDQMSVIVLSDRNNYYGIVVDRFLGERELVVQVLPEVLGKVQDISSAALMENGAPVLIVDIDDLIRSIEKVLKVARLGKVSKLLEEEEDGVKRILVVDDSITVREVERKLLETAGYQVQTAVDGMDGLNMLRSESFDMLVTDVDMPRMNGIDLVKTVRQDATMRTLPVLMVSYKDREEDRLRGLEAGADYYLTKGSFHDETLLQAVVDLIGDASK